MSRAHPDFPVLPSGDDVPEEGRAVSVGSGDWFASVFPTGEARFVNIGTERKPCWVVEGPKPSRADFEWSRDVTLGALNKLSAHTQNRWNSPVESESGNASGECVCADSISSANTSFARSAENQKP